MAIERAPDSIAIAAEVKNRLIKLGLVKHNEVRNGPVAAALEQVVFVKKDDLKYLIAIADDPDFDSGKPEDVLKIYGEEIK